MNKRLKELTMKKVFGKYYFPEEEVEELVDKMDEELGQCAVSRQRLEELLEMEESYKELREQSDILKAKYGRMELERSKLQDTLTHQKNLAFSEKSTLSEEINSLRDELERAKMREAFLNADVERKKVEMEKFGKLISTDTVAQAEEKAQKIVADATAESERILTEYSNQRARVVAATRAAYYNALQFKLSLTERFNMMERDLDDTIDVLRMLEIPASAPPAAIQDGQTVTSD